MTSEKQVLKPTGNPISEGTYMVLSAFTIIMTSTLIDPASSSSSGFNDLAVALGLFMTLFITILSIPFLIKALRRNIAFEWFTKYVIILPLILLVVTVYILVMIDATPQLWGIMMVGEIIPVVLILVLKK